MIGGAKRRGGAPGNSNKGGRSKEAAEATRDGGDHRRYVSRAWAGRRGLEPGGVVCQCRVRAPGGGDPGTRRKVGVAGGSVPLALFSLFPPLRGSAPDYGT